MKRNLNHFICLGFLFVCLTTGKAADSHQQRVVALIEKAKATSTRSQADIFYNQADKYVREQVNLGERQRIFLKNQIRKERAQTYYSLWRKDKSDQQLITDAKKLFDDAIREYEYLREDCQNQRNRAQESKRVLELQKDLTFKQMNIDLTRAEYELGWAHYWRAKMSEGQERTDHLKIGSSHFFKLTTKGYIPNSPFSADCFYGHALCLYELGQYKRVKDEILKQDVITSHNTDATKFKQITMIRLRCCRKLDATLADKFASDYFHSLCGSQANNLKLDDRDYNLHLLCQNVPLDEIDLAIALEWTQSLVEIIEISDPQMQTSAKRKLISLSKLIEPQGDIWRQRLISILGQQGEQTAFTYKVKAQNLFNKKAYDKALIEAESGLMYGNQPGSQEHRADLYYLRFACHWNLKHWLDAFEAAIEFIRDFPSDQRAKDVCSKAMQCALKALSATPALEVTNFLKTVQYCEKQFSTVPEVQQIKLRAARMFTVDQQWQQAQRLLKSIEPNHPSYGSAQYDLANILFMQIKSKIELGSIEAASSAGQLVDAAVAFCNYIQKLNTRTDADLPPVADVISLGAGITIGLLELNPPDVVHAKRLVETINQQPSYAIDNLFSALEFRINILSGDLNRACELISKITVDAPQIMNIMHNSISFIEHKRNDTQSDSTQWTTQEMDSLLVTLYEKLLDYHRTSQDPLFERQEPFLRFHLAEALYRLNNIEKALEHYLWLSETLPDAVAGGAKRGLALCYEAKEDYQQALPSWRILYNGLDIGTDAWLEAAYHLVFCQIKMGQIDSAKNRLDYIRIETETIDLGHWEPKFDSLEQTLSDRAAVN